MSTESGQLHVASLIARVAALGAYGVADAQLSHLSNRLSTLEQRLSTIESLGVPHLTISGTQLRLLALCVLRESNKLFDHVDAEQAMAELDLEPVGFAEAVEDLRDFGLVGATGVLAKHRFTHLVLRGSAFVAAAPMLLPEIDVPRELGLVLAEFRKLRPGSYRVLSKSIAESSGIPVPRLDLLLKSLEERGLIERSGTGSPEWGSAMTLTLTSAGRRFLGESSGVA